MYNFEQYVAYATCMLRLLYILCALYTLARAHNVRDLSQELLRHASNLCGPFLCNRASCCVPEAPLKGPLHMIFP